VRAECKACFQKSLVRRLYTASKSMKKNQSLGLYVFHTARSDVRSGGRGSIMCYNNVPSTYTTNFLRSFYGLKKLLVQYNFFIM
jgi:hypothetical protein